MCKAVAWHRAHLVCRESERNVLMKAKPYTEADFTRDVLHLAHLYGWRTAHFLPGMNRRGKWQTAVQGDGKGFLDLVLIRERIIWAELKSENGKVTPEQKDWIKSLTSAGQEVYVWKPSEWHEIESVLK